MRYSEFITESLSRVAYHYTNLHAASKIMASGEFELSSDLGSVEQEYSPRGYHYFLSTTRTKLGGYHHYIGSSAAMFVLDGNWFNEHYKSGSVDYWTNKNPETGEIESRRGPQGQQYRKPHEAEDRVYSKTPTIPIDGVSAIHVLITPENTNEWSGSWARTVFINAKRRGIPAYLYNDEDAWRRLDSKHSVSLANNPTLRGQQYVTTRQSMYKRKGYLYPWVQLITATNKTQLGKDADSLRYSLAYTYDLRDALKGLAAEMSNARKPSAGVDRENAIKIINYMRKHKLTTLSELVDYLKAKWHPKKD